uniref:Transmembrane Fragile-X-F protein n=1 Tax=Salmonella phage vB_SEnST11_KE23 TaxID=3161174 RepID=A0AAU8GIU2_9CAUD
MKFLSALALLFIALKLCGVIAWSWWWVLAPLYFPFAIFVGMIILFFASVFGVAGAAALLEKIKLSKKRSR